MVAIQGININKVYEKANNNTDGSHGNAYGSPRDRSNQ